MSAQYQPFGNIVTACVTPFTEDGEEIDWDALPNLLAHLEQSSDTVMIMGTTGEGPTVRAGERGEFISASRELLSDTRLMVNVGTNSTAKSVKNAEQARELGADGVMAVMPYYNKPNPEGQFLHFREIARAAEVPLLLYNIPGRSARRIEPEVVLRLAGELDNVVAIKEASGSTAYSSRLLSELDGGVDFAVYAGDDGLLLPVLAVGGVGVVSVASHLIGAELKRLCELYFAGEVKGAREIHQRHYGLLEALFTDTNPIPLKATLAERGLIEESYRLPMAPLTGEDREYLMQVLKQHRLLVEEE